MGGSMRHRVIALALIAAVGSGAVSMAEVGGTSGSPPPLPMPPPAEPNENPRLAILKAKIIRAADLYNATYLATDPKVHWRYIANSVRKLDRKCSFFGGCDVVNFTIDVRDTQTGERREASAYVVFKGADGYENWQAHDWGVRTGEAYTLPADTASVASLIAANKQEKLDTEAFPVVKARCLRQDGWQRRSHTATRQKAFDPARPYAPSEKESYIVEDQPIPIYRNICSVTIKATCSGQQLTWGPQDVVASNLPYCRTPNR
jgi:hypothetical protein